MSGRLDNIGELAERESEWTIRYPYRKISALSKAWTQLKNKLHTMRVTNIVGSRYYFLSTIPVDISSRTRRRNNIVSDEEMFQEVCAAWCWNPDDTITIYTDGSKNPNAESVGAAVRIPHTGHVISNSLPKDAKIFKQKRERSTEH